MLLQLGRSGAHLDRPLPKIAKSGISAATRHGHPVVSHCVMGAIAERPSRTAAKIVAGSMPAPQTAPVPVTRTRREVILPYVSIRARACAVDFGRIAQHDAAVRAAESE